MTEHTLPPGRALTYITAGHGKATLVGETARYTYSFNTSKDDRLVFVRVLTGSDNENDYTYIGYIPVVDNGGVLRLVAGKKGSPGHLAFVGLAWYIHQAQTKPELAEKLTFMHEGTCGKCGRTLTTPESIERGIGPKCYGASSNAHN